MTHEERQRAYQVIKTVLPFLTDEELKALVAVVVTRETVDGTPLRNL